MAPSTSSKGTSSKSTSSKSTSSKSTSSKSRSSKSTSSKSTSSKSTSSKSTSSKSTSANKSKERISSRDSLLNYSSPRSDDEHALNQCICCGKCFTTEDLLIGHIQQNHPYGSTPCIKCNLTDVSGWVGRDPTSVLWHMYYYHRPEGYSCEVCEESFDNHGILSQHMYNTNHRKSEEFACLQCGAQFPIVDYKMHSLWHKVKVTCEVCRKMINTEDYKEHTNIHPYFKRFEEPKGQPPELTKSFWGLPLNGISCLSRNCDMMFSRERNMYQHFASAHVKTLFFICNMCLETFTSQEILRRHQRIHHNDNPLYMFEKPQFAFTCDTKYDDLDILEIDELSKDPKNKNKVRMLKVRYGNI